ncbi:MAG: hypothetical protein SPK28_06120 [Bacilli bacterium]|nr:hypothetical protein [Bacilli bacterium]
MEEKNTKKKNLIFSMLFSLLCVFLVTIPTLTFAWFKQYMNVTSKTITITSGESVAYIEIEIYTYTYNYETKTMNINGPLAQHSSLGLNVNCTPTTDDSGVVNVSVGNVIVDPADLTLGYGGLNNQDFFNPNYLPEFMIEFRIIKELFSSYVKSSVTVKANSGINLYYDSNGSESTTPLATPFLFRQQIFDNNATDVVGSCIRNNTTLNPNGDNTNVESMRNVLPSSLPTVNSETNIFNNLEVPQFNKKKPGSENDIAYSKAIIYDVCLDPALILFTMQETNKGTYSKSMSFNLSLQFTFELSNDPFKA